MGSVSSRGLQVRGGSMKGSRVGEWPKKESQATKNGYSPSGQVMRSFLPPPRVRFGGPIRGSIFEGLFETRVRK